MPNPKQPIKLIQAKGKKHLTKSEIEERALSEPQPITDGIAPPNFLLKPQKKRFDEIANQLQDLGVMGVTDCDALGRYIIAEDMYIKITDKLTEAMESSNLYLDMDDFDVDEYMGALKVVEKYAGLQDKYFKQCRAAANDLGLSISARCRLVVPKAQEKPPENKFNKFQAQAG
jgi:P27 family predicted phage terminase small subunit